jgi:hypothetical protein
MSARQSVPRKPEVEVHRGNAMSEINLDKDLEALMQDSGSA